MLRSVVLFSFVLLWSSLVTACTTNGDCGSSDNTQSGLCVSGVCQCGIGFSGNQLIDPTSCSLQCSPAAVPDSVAFLIEPNVTVAADSGNLVLSVDMLPYLKQSPASVSLLNPNNGTACALMPQQLGTGKWAQSVLNDASQCGLRYVFSSAFAATVGQACWDAQAPTTETGSQYSVTFNSYKTQVEVVQQGLAPFGQAAARATTTSETSITRVFRRDYTISVATQFSPTTAPFSVIANGALRYRLVKIVYDVLGKMIAATVQTQTANTAKVMNVSVVLGASGSSGIAPVIGDVVWQSQCDASSAAGTCDQYHLIKFQDTPCSVSQAELVLSAAFVCADGRDPSLCGFVNLPTDNTYRLNNIILTYDACARVVQYGVDSSKSYLRLHTDVARTTALSAPATQGTVVYGQCNIQPTSGALFQSVTLSSLAVVQQTSNGPQNLGNQLAATFLTLLSPAQQTSPSNPVWNFDLLIDPAFFGLTNVYYLEATLDLVFTNTGPLTKRLRIPLTSLSMLRQQANVELVALNSRATPTALSQGGIFSQTFRLTASSSSSASVSTSSSGTVSAVQSSNSSSSSTVAIAVGVAVGAAVLCAVGIVIAVVIVRRRKQEQRGRASSDAPLTAVVSSIPSTIFVDAE